MHEQLTWKPWTDHIVSQIISRTSAISRISSTVPLIPRKRWNINFFQRLMIYLENEDDGASGRKSPVEEIPTKNEEDAMR